MLKLFLSIAYFPPVSYFFHYLKAGTVLIERHETYTKQTYRNRCRILTPGGIQTLTIPVVKPSGNHSSIREVYPSPTEPWQSLHWKTIVSAYNNSPFFKYYEDDFKPFFLDPPGSLFELDMELLNLLLHLLKIEPRHTLTECYFHDPSGGEDLRHAIHPKRPDNTLVFPLYVQVFNDRIPFIPDLSIMDLLFNLGPDSVDYLKKIQRV